MIVAVDSVGFFSGNRRSPAGVVRQRWIDDEARSSFGIVRSLFNYKSLPELFMPPPF